MNIVVISNGYPSKEEPQFGCFEKDQALALKHYGHNVSILYLDSRFRKIKRKVGVTHFIENGINIYGLYLYPTAITAHLNRQLNYYIRRKLFDFLFRFMLKRQDVPDVIYAHYQYNIYYATFLKAKYNIPLVGIEHWSKLMSNTLPAHIVYCGRRAYTFSDRVLAVSMSLQQSIHHFWGIKPLVVDNMLGDEFMQENGVRRQKREKPIRFITIGSLIYLKRIDLLISAFFDSNLSNKGCELLIVGDGVERKHLQQRVNDLGINDSVFFLGRKSKSEIIEYLKSSDVFVLSSQSETFSVVCIEAMSLGLPIIATKCGGPESFVDEQCGILISVNDQKELTFALTYMSENSNKYDSITISKKCKQRFAPSVIAKQLTDIFEEVVASYHSQSK